MIAVILAAVITSGFLSSISEERDGFRFGEPKRISNNSLLAALPILRDTDLTRDYVTLPEKLDIVELTDTGEIDKILALNKGDRPIYIRSGTIFKGATQERVSVRSSVLLPNKKTILEVRCINASRMILTDASLTYGGVTPLSMDAELYTWGFQPAGQAAYWSSVSSNISTTQQTLAASDIQVDAVAQDDLVASLSRVGTEIDDVIRKIKRQEKQVGVAFFTDKGCNSIEVFDHDDSWKAFHEDAIRRLGADVLKEDDAGVFEYHPERAADKCQKVLTLDYTENVIWEHKKSNGEPNIRIIGLTSQPYIGEAVEIKGRIVHLLINRSEQ